MDSELTGRFLCGIPLECLTYPLNEIRTEIFTPIEADLKAYECRSPFPRLYTIYVPSNSPRYIYIIEGSNNWIYADFLDIGEYNATVSVCLNAGGRYFCFGQTIELGSVRLIVGANSKRLFPHGGHYYLDSKADHDNVDDISVAL